MDGDGRRNDSNQSAASSSHYTYPAGRLEIILPFAPNNVELSMPTPSGRPSSDGPQPGVENMRSGGNPSVQIEDNMIHSNDIDLDWTSSDESENEGAISYEVQQKLRVLRGKIRDANNRLSEEYIAINLSRRIYQSAEGTSTDHGDELQEEPGDGEEVARLECGHEFHYSCIKEWLVQKNSCPICKRIGLTVG